MIFTQQFKEQVRESKFVQQLKAGVIEIDNSTFLNWDGCFVSGIYSGALKRVSGRSRAPLSFGSSVHAGLEEFFKGASTEACVQCALDWANKEKLDELHDPKRNTRQLEVLLRSYVMEYQRRADMRFHPLVDSKGAPMVERSFSVPLGSLVLERMKNFETPMNMQVVWTGKIDVLETFENKICVVDHKTTSVMGEKFVDDKERSSQMLGYTYAAKWLSASLFDGKPVYGVRVNALAQRSSGFEFKVFNIPYSDWQVAEWHSETLLALQTLVRRLDDFLSSNEAAPTRGHCVTKYGKCSYFDVCELMPIMRDRLLNDDSYYYTSTWSPLGSE